MIIDKKGWRMRYINMIGIIGLLAGILLAACAAPASDQAAGEQARTSEQAAGEQVTAAQATREMIVYRSPTCGCCSDWVGYMQQHGYTVTVEDVQDLAALKAEHNVPSALQSCHTAVIDGYVIEGHVPVEDIERLLTERPAVVGIGVPGMPVGSPGMEVDGVAPQPFDVMTFDVSGATEVYSSYHQ